MANPRGNPQNLKPFKPGQSGNPAGLPPGTKNLSTWIQDLLNDETFVTGVLDSKEGYKEVTGAPIKAIIIVAIKKAVAGDEKAREWLAKYGYGSKITIQNTDDNADDWFRSIDDQEKELAAHAAKKRRRSPKKQSVAPNPPVQNQG